jgi:hypothetical protein
VLGSTLSGLAALAERAREAGVDVDLDADVPEGHLDGAIDAAGYRMELYISPATARTYVSRLLAKLGVRDRARRIVIAYETGLITPGF